MLDRGVGGCRAAWGGLVVRVWRKTEPSTAMPRVAPSCWTALRSPYLTRRLATLDGVTTIETALVLHTLKAAGPLPTSTLHRPASPRAHHTGF
jgi:hypothetical protein